MTDLGDLKYFARPSFIALQSFYQELEKLGLSPREREEMIMLYADLAEKRRERRKKYTKAWAKQHPLQIREKNRKWAREHPERARSYYWRHHEKMLQYYRLRYKIQKERRIEAGKS
ncbi:MAG: hypothetical protein QXP38_00560 [Nitrososphaerota archaeon]